MHKLRKLALIPVIVGVLLISAAPAFADFVCPVLRYQARPTTMLMRASLKSPEEIPRYCPGTLAARGTRLWMFQTMLQTATAAGILVAHMPFREIRATPQSGTTKAEQITPRLQELAPQCE